MSQLAAAGATPISLPAIAIAPPADAAPLATARGCVTDFDGFIFTSANAAAAFLALPTPARPLASWVCAVGPATAAALAAYPGWTADIVPADYSAEGVIAALAGHSLAEKRILFPRSASGRELIPEALAARGARMDVVEAYRTVVAEASRGRALELFPATGASGAECVIFTSGSTVRNFTSLLGGDFRQRLCAVALAALGPATRAVMAELDLACAVEAPQATAASLVKALAAYFYARTAGS